MRKLVTFVAVFLGLLAVPATASALKFEAAPGTPLAPATSVIDPSPVMPPGFSPTDIATGDFNKDGYGDIAVITDYISVQGPDGPEISPLSKNIYVYLGSADGSLESSASNPIGADSPIAGGRFMIRAIDVDGDGDLDLVTGSGGNPTIIEIYQNGFNGTHEAFATVPGQTLSLDDSESAAGYRSVSLGDQDDDGDVDMALGLYDNRYVFIRNLSSLDGLEIPNPSVEVSRDDPQDIDGITSTAIGNFGDGTGPDAFGDLVMVSSPGFRAENQPPDRLLYARGDGASSFASPVELLRTGTDEYLGWVSKADLNGDQYDDIVFKVQTATGENIVRAALGSADGPVIQAGEGSSISVYGAQQPAPGDFNGDGDQDVAIPQFVDDGFQVGLGDGSGRLALDFAGPFALAAVDSADFFPQASATLDANGDGRLDFAAASGHSGDADQARGVAVMLNKPSSGISVSPTSIHFGDVPFDAELIAPVPVTIKSNGDLPLNLGQIGFSGPATGGFSLDRGNCPNGNLASGSTCTLEVSMKQNQSGYFNGFLDITSDATGDPVRIEVIGQVGEAPPTARGLSLKVKSAKKVKAGKKLVVSAIVRNSGKARSAHFTIRATAPKKMTGRIKFSPLRNLSLDGRSYTTFFFKVPVKKQAKGVLRVKVSLVAKNRKIVRKTGEVRIVKKARRR